MSDKQRELLAQALAVVGFVFGFVALVAPKVLVNLYAGEDSATTQTVIRFFGATQLGFALIAWQLRSVRESWSAFFTSCALVQFLFVAAGVVGMNAGGVGPFMWQVVVLSGIFTVLCLVARRQTA